MARAWIEWRAIMNSSGARAGSVELQATRGLAAALVMCHHSLRTAVTGGALHFISDVILNAHAAVVLFFVLSGYVLTASIWDKLESWSDAVAFYARRAFRIYPALWVGVSLGLLYFVLLSTLPAPHGSEWFRSSYLRADYSPAKAIAGYAALSTFPLPILWTIVIELAASIAIPAFVVLARRRAWAGIVMIFFLGLLSFLKPEGVKLVPLYMVDFAIGSSLFQLIRSGHRFSRAVELSIACLAFAALLFFRQMHGWAYHAPAPGIVEAFSAAALIRSGVIGLLPALRRRPLAFLGDISYSVYLLHMPVAFAFMRLLEAAPLSWSGDLLALAVVATTVPTTLLLASIVYRFVEVPGIAAGRRAVSWLQAYTWSRAAKRYSRRAPPASVRGVRPPAPSAWS